VERCLEDDGLNWMAASLLFELPDPPATLLARALEVASKEPSRVESICTRKEVPLATVKLFLHHPNWEVSLAAAVGEWVSDPQKSVRSELLEAWRSAVVRASVREDAPDSYWLEMILASDGELAFDWLNARLREPGVWSGFPAEGPFAHAVGALTSEQRRQILDQLESCETELVSGHCFLIPLIVGRDLALYRALLKKTSLAAYHDEPLSGVPDASWEKLALEALEAGIEPGRVAAASMRGAESYAGEDVWRPWHVGFTRLSASPREDLRSVGRLGREFAERKYEDERRRQHQLEIHGLR
jgi:hypothetical protein